MKQLKNHRSYCYICGKPNADSDDHIPPKCLFPKRYHKTVPKVPAHNECNSRYSNEDTYFRDCLTMASANENKIAHEVFYDAVVRSWTKKEAVNYWKYLKSQFLKIKSPYPNTELYRIDAKRILNQICRISRGLFYFEYKKPMSLDLIVDAHMVEPNSEFREIVNIFGKSIVNKSYQYFIFIPDPKIVLGSITMCFYNKIWFQVNISDKNS
jgi:hypothetical protein